MIRGSVVIELPQQDQGQNLGLKQLFPNQNATQDGILTEFSHSE